VRLRGVWALGWDLREWKGIVDCRRFAIDTPDRRETREQVEQQLKLMKKVKESLGELQDTPIVVGLECTLIVLWNLYKT
jgi:uncharacterized membrane protein